MGSVTRLSAHGRTTCLIGLDPGPCIHPRGPSLKGRRELRRLWSLESYSTPDLPWQTTFHRFWTLVLPLCSRWGFSWSTVSNRKSYHRCIHSVCNSGVAGVCGRRNRLRLERLIMRRRGYLPSDFLNIESLAEEVDRRLFQSITKPMSYVFYLLTNQPLRLPSCYGA